MVRLRACLAGAALMTASALHAQAGRVPIVIETALGTIEAELDSARAPGSVVNFLKYVDAHAYDGGRFHRTVRADNQPDNAVKIDVIQGGVRLSPPITIHRIARRS